MKVRMVALVWLAALGMAATEAALQDPVKKEDDKYKAATMLSLLSDAQDQVKEVGENAELVQIDGSGLGGGGTVDLTKEGHMLSYSFKVGEKFWSVTYLGYPTGKPNPMESVAEVKKPKTIEKLSKLKAVSKDEIGKLKDSPELVKIAKGEGLSIGGEPVVMVSCEHPQGEKVRVLIMVGEAFAICEAISGKLKVLSDGKKKGK